MEILQRWCFHRKRHVVASHEKRPATLSSTVKKRDDEALRRRQNLTRLPRNDCSSVTLR
jgi:hypothetical protein